jgi:lipoprotein-releasing system permease protein
MNCELFIARRIHFSKEKGDNKRVTPPVIRISMAGITIGVAVMIVAVAIVVGFKKEVRNKVIGFGAHIQLTNFDSNISYETIPIAVNDSLLDELRNTAGVEHVEVFATKPGMIKTETDFHGIALKGVGNDFDTLFFSRHLVEGKMPAYNNENISNQIVISEHIAKALRLKCGDSFLAYFVNSGEVRARKFAIAGIYNTGFADYDKLFVICDIKHVRRLNGWDDDMASGAAIFIYDYSQLDRIAEELYFSMISRKDRLGNTFYVRSIKELNPMIFNWLGVLDSNVAVLLALMVLVSGFTMISGLLIIILEHTNMIGTLKAIGESNKSIGKIFLYIAGFLIVKGMFWGNIIGLTLCALQAHFRWLKLSPETYYLDSVPIELSWQSLFLINICSATISILMMLCPTFLIAKIEPSKSIRFE